MTKYTDQQYIDAEYFGPDEETRNNELKVITTRTPHDCVAGWSDDCVEEIPPRTRAIRETAIHVDNGRVSCYLCLPCADWWLDEIHGN